MTQAEQILEAAVDWLTKLREQDVGEADWRAFDAWLDGHPANKAAYDAAVMLYAEVDHLAPRLRDALDEGGVVVPFPNRAARTAPGRSRTRRCLPAAGSAMAAAAAVAAAVVIAPWNVATPYQTYATGKGEHKTITLADGSRIDLNAASHISVRMEKSARRVVMDDAQAIFDVAKDEKRPFLITVGDETVRVVGTQFDVRHRDGRVAVTVSRGLVEVSPKSGGAGSAVRLRPGQQLEHVEGGEDAAVSEVSPDEVFGWRSGRLIYRDRPLSEVAADLNRYFAKPVRLDGAQTANLRFSGVLMVDGQDATVRRLTELLPVSATFSGGAVVLHSR